ncbi:MAG: ABC transporter ATP-binding protein [Victivallaceae bacterium]|nr:ABC transporter ATP-binding protein [Victivallaceae bacterium]
MEQFILEVESVAKSYDTGAGKLQVLRDVSMKVCRGDWCCIFGASGSGKTTLLNILGTLERPDSGTVRIDGQDVSGFSRREAARFRGKRIGFVFQAYHLLPELTVIENVAVAAGAAGLADGGVRERAAKLLDKMGLSSRLDHLPSQLSGGEQQRVAIARALINNPDIILADEPTGNLDSSTGEGILDLLTSLRTERPGLTIVMITHNRDLASRADRLVELSDGKVAVSQSRAQA